jgi:hypothetical protein
MADPIFEHPRLASVYDALDPVGGGRTPYGACAESGVVAFRQA